MLIFQQLDRPELLHCRNDLQKMKVLLQEKTRLSRKQMNRGEMMIAFEFLIEEVLKRD